MSTSKHIGRKFGKLTAVAVVRIERPSKTAYIQVIKTVCDCGATREVRMTALLCGQVKACHTCARPPRQNPYRHPLYNRYYAMLSRCTNPSDPGFKYYGAKGVDVCARWRAPAPHGFDNFVADMGPCPADHSLDRIDPTGNYEPTNCRWATVSTQSTNTRKGAMYSMPPTPKALRPRKPRKPRKPTTVYVWRKTKTPSHSDHLAEARRLLDDTLDHITA